MEFQEYTTYTYGDHYVRERTEVVVEGQVETRGARVALAAGTTAQLVVDAPGLVALGAEDVQTVKVGHALAEHDVRAAAGHVGGDGHAAGHAGLGHDLGFLLVVFGV